MKFNFSFAFCKVRFINDLLNSYANKKVKKYEETWVEGWGLFCDLENYRKCNLGIFDIKIIKIKPMYGMK